jgi:hypothetical protein
MNIITIEGSSKAVAAGHWATINIQGNWTLDLESFSDRPMYKFKFDKPTDASWFALKWL